MFVTRTRTTHVNETRTVIDSINDVRSVCFDDNNVRVASDTRSQWGGFSTPALQIPKKKDIVTIHTFL